MSLYPANRSVRPLEEMGLPYEIVGMDHPNEDLDSPACRALNPFGQIPVIDDEGVEAQVLRWSIAALNTIEVTVLTLWFVNLSGGKGSGPSEALRQWADTATCRVAAPIRSC